MEQIRKLRTYPVVDNHAVAEGAAHKYVVHFDTEQMPPAKPVLVDYQMTRVILLFEEARFCDLKHTAGREFGDSRSDSKTGRLTFRIGG
jgi:hypothetical protein